MRLKIDAISLAKLVREQVQLPYHSNQNKYKKSFLSFQESTTRESTQTKNKQNSFYLSQIFQINCYTIPKIIPTRSVTFLGLLYGTYETKDQK